MPKNPAIARDPVDVAPDRSPNQETVQSIHVAGVTYELRLVNCGKTNCRRCNIDGRSAPSHGPYWYIRFTEKGKTRRVYMGKDLDTRKYRDANGAITLEGIRRDRQGLPLEDPPPPAQDPGDGHRTTLVGETNVDREPIRLARRRRLEALEEAATPPKPSFAERLSGWCGRCKVPLKYREESHRAR